MENFNKIEDLYVGIKAKLDSATSNKKIIALYAFNSTGKTRLTNMFDGISSDTENEEEKIRVLCYNSFFEDMFKWDNENHILKYDINSWIIKLVIEQGLENKIINNFNDLVDSNIEPTFNFTEGSVVFSIVSGDDSSITGIKISKAEESMFIWSIFFAALESASDELDSLQEERTTQIFNDLKYVIIDDPVSSIDDTKIILMAIKLVNLFKLIKSNRLKILITTHHALFYNVIVNSLKRETSAFSFERYSLSKDNQMFKLRKQNDSPFAYHLSIKKIIRESIADDKIERYHFNLFRNLLEKTSNFLGYDYWADCITGSNKEEFIRLLNLYSHSRISDLEGRELSKSDRIIFEETFNTFVQHFKWK